MFIPRASYDPSPGTYATVFGLFYYCSKLWFERNIAVWDVGGGEVDLVQNEHKNTYSIGVV